MAVFFSSLGFFSRRLQHPSRLQPAHKNDKVTKKGACTLPLTWSARKTGGAPARHAQLLRALALALKHRVEGDALFVLFVRRGRTETKETWAA
jgi:hypothetical protein